MAKHRIVGIHFDHMHMGDLLRLVMDHPDAEVVGVWHEEPTKPTEVLGRLGLPQSLLFNDWRRCIEQTKPTAAVLCPSTGGHREWVCRVAEYGLDILVEKPFAANLADADAMAEAVEGKGRRLAINWPLAWYPAHRTAKRLLDEGRIGHLLNVHYYDGNRGPAMHKMDKIEVNDPDELMREKQSSWFYKPEHAGGSLQDYLGYGTTLATWYHHGKRPTEVTCMADRPTGLDVDEHSVTIARYDVGLSKFETRWGTFTDPWTVQPLPRCGFVLCGDAGTIASYDFAPTLQVQTNDKPEGQEIPVDALAAPQTDGITYFLDCIDRDAPIEGPLSPTISRIGQEIVDAAARSVEEGGAVKLD
ncbi:MAG: Gfo/Idh/MocA family oxidoreductase [Planctomycetota bacterium]